MTPKSIFCQKKKKMHTCISCGNLHSVHRRVLKTPDGKYIGYPSDGKYIGYRFVASCTLGRRKRNPWTAMSCPMWEERPDQKILDYFLDLNLKKREKDPALNPDPKD